MSRAGPLATGQNEGPQTQEGKSGRCCSYGLAFMAVVREVGWAEGNIWNGEASRLLTAADRLRLGSRRRGWGQKTEQKIPSIDLNLRSGLALLRKWLCCPMARHPKSFHSNR